MALQQRVTNTDLTESNPHSYRHLGDSAWIVTPTLLVSSPRFRIHTAETRTNIAPTELFGHDMSKTCIYVAGTDQLMAEWCITEQQRKLRPERLAFIPGSDRDALLAPYIRRLGELALLEDDWDSYGGRPPDWNALKAAYRLFSLVLERYGGYLGSRVRPTAISPLASGGVELEWKGKDRLIAIEADPEGKWSVMKRFGNDRSATYEEEFDVAEQLLPAMILETLGTSA